MELDRGTWGRFAVRVLALGLVVFGAVRLAVARDGLAGGASRSFVTVAGTLTGVTGSGVGLTFSFRRALGDGGVAPALCAPTVATTVREGGAFSAEVPLASDASRCPDDLFDGRDVVVEVAVNGTPINGRFSVNPVPYAIRADVANAAGGQLETRLAALDARIQGIENSAGMVARGAGTSSAASLRVPVPLSGLVGGRSTPRGQRALLLTLRASNGRGLVHTGVWLVISGDQSGARVTLLGAHRYVGVSAIDVEATTDQGLFATDDVERGVTLVFANWPTTGPWQWSYTSVPVDLPPMS